MITPRAPTIWPIALTASQFIQGRKNCAAPWGLGPEFYCRRRILEAFLCWVRPQATAPLLARAATLSEKSGGRSSATPVRHPGGLVELDPPSVAAVCDRRFARISNRRS